MRFDAESLDRVGFFVEVEDLVASGLGVPEAEFECTCVFQTAGSPQGLAESVKRPEVRAVVAPGVKVAFSGLRPVLPQLRGGAAKSLESRIAAQFWREPLERVNQFLWLSGFIATQQQ